MGLDETLFPEVSDPVIAMRPAPLALILVFLCVLAGCGGDTPKLEKGQPAPAFSLPDLTGNLLHYPQDLRGEVVVVRFWADWCPFCGPEMRDIEPIYQQFRDQGLRILAVNVRQDQKTAARFVESLGISYRTLLDEDGALARRYGVSGLPTTYFLNRDGKIHARVLGEAAPGLFAKLVAELL